jgi:ArsR family transcriptional regulator
LRRTGLVEARRDGLWMHYKLAPAQTSFHKSLLDCLAHCTSEMHQLAKDAKRLKRTRCC